MQPTNFDEVLEKILETDTRYHRDAYYFAREALDFTQKRVGKSSKKEMRHVTGKQLLEGLRDFALDQFGPMALMVLQEWGVNRSEDVGEIVFNLVEHKFLAKTETDTREDFKDGFDFETTFREPFLPPSRAQKSPASAETAPDMAPPSGEPPAAA
jgi:uncharacterized repeat protein (TIGR04138 family)